MKKRILFLGFIIMSVFLLSACTEITDDYNKKQEPSIKLKNEGELIQIYEDGVALEEIVFTVTFDKFTENGIDLSKVEINWYIREQLILEHKNKTSITQKVTSPGDIPVRVEVVFLRDGKNERLEDNALISVVKTPTQLLVLNSIDQTKNNFSLTIGGNTNVTFIGKISGNLNHDIIKWVILKETSTEPELLEEVIINKNEIEVENNIGTVTLLYSFSESGNYIVSLQTGEGYTQDANKYVSNTTHINVNYGVFEINTDNEKIMVSTSANFNRVLKVNELDKNVVGEGVYKWYLNGQEINNDNKNFYVHESSSLGSFVYQVKFYMNNSDEIIETEPFLILNGLEVSNEAELLEAFENNISGIIFKEDITYTSTETLQINSNTAIYGNGFTFSSSEIETFLKVTNKTNVVFANITLDKSQKYSLHIERSNNVYLENIKFSDFGDTEFSKILLGEFNAGLYIDRSQVAINNIEFLSEGLVGIRLDQHLNTEGVTILKLYGELKYDLQNPVLLPVGSGKSDLEGVHFIASGFDYFALPAGNITIRRWDNIGEPISWEIYDPEKTKYHSGEFLDLFGIGINIDISFLMGESFELDGVEGLEFVKQYISYFKQYGKIEIINTSDTTETPVKTYYIVGSDNEKVYGYDKLVYSLSKDIKTGSSYESQVRPDLPTEPGEYKIKIFIGEEFYLGFIIITVE